MLWLRRFGLPQKSGSTLLALMPDHTGSMSPAEEVAVLKAARLVHPVSTGPPDATGIFYANRGEDRLNK